MKECRDCRDIFQLYAGYQMGEFSGVEPKKVELYQIEDILNYYTVLLADIDINYRGMDLTEFGKKYGSGTEEVFNQLAAEPGIFFAYYYGYYQIDALRQKAQEQLQGQFDDVEFNNALLRSGSVNYTIVEKSIDRYIEEAPKK